MNAFVVLLLAGLAAAKPTGTPYKLEVYEATPTARTPEITPIGIAGIQSSPVIALAKGPNAYTAYLLEHGLTSLAYSQAPAVQTLRQTLQSSNVNTALVVPPATLYEEQNPVWEQIRTLPIAQIEAPEASYVSSIAKYAAYKLPIVVLYEKEELAARNYQGLKKYGQVDLSALEVPSWYQAEGAATGPYRSPAGSPTAGAVAVPAGSPVVGAPAGLYRSPAGSPTARAVAGLYKSPAGAPASGVIAGSPVATPAGTPVAGAPTGLYKSPAGAPASGVIAGSPVATPAGTPVAGAPTGLYKSPAGAPASGVIAGSPVATPAGTPVAGAPTGPYKSPVAPVNGAPAPVPAPAP